MNTYQQLKKLGEIIAELTALYGELSEELPKLKVVSAPAPADSEVKKCPEDHTVRGEGGGARNRA